MPDHDDMADDYWDDEDDMYGYVCECCGEDVEGDYGVTCDACTEMTDEHDVCRLHGRRV